MEYNIISTPRIQKEKIIPNPTNPNPKINIYYQVYHMAPEITFDIWYLVCNHISSATKSRLASRETGDGLTGTDSGGEVLQPVR